MFFRSIGNTTEDGKILYKIYLLKVIDLIIKYKFINYPSIYNNNISNNKKSEDDDNDNVLKCHSELNINGASVIESKGKELLKMNLKSIKELKQLDIIMKMIF